MLEEEEEEEASVVAPRPSAADLKEGGERERERERENACLDRWKEAEGSDWNYSSASFPLAEAAIPAWL